jgi:prepilin-type N-terminal cleavage/methylation domain-containing protein
MRHNNSCKRCAPTRRAFTLAELLVVIVIISMMAALALSALSGATEIAREQRTRAIISKLDNLIMERYESYRTRPMPMRVSPGTTPRQAALNRLNVLRELIRLELPDRISDLCTSSELTDLQSGDNMLNAISNRNDAMHVSGLSAIPSVARSYKRRAQKAIATSGGWSSAHQGSECLYLIVSTMQDGDKSALDFFLSGEIGDVDEDGMNEILDGWGTPIEFLRWAPAFTIENGALTTQTSSFTTTPPQRMAPDPFDPVRVDPRANSTSSTACFALMPLIFSAGRDKEYDLDVGNAVYAQTANTSLTPQIPPNDPYYGAGGAAPATGQSIGPGFGDNITNHYQETP